ncbi:hypothetical protein SprV_0200655000 [Sparganum proliferum]
MPAQCFIQPSIQRSPQYTVHAAQAHSALTWFSPPVEAVARGVAAEQSPATGSHRYPPGHAIIRQGRFPINYYLILSGEVVVSVLRSDRGEHTGYEETLSVLKKGTSFGDLAIMYNSGRFTTVSSKTTVELMVTSRTTFMEVFMKAGTASEPEHIAILRSIPLLPKEVIDVLPFDDKSVCLYSYVSRGTVLCKDSNRSDWIYVVMTGEMNILQKLTFKTVQGSLMPAREGDPRSQTMLVQVKTLEATAVFGLEPIAFEALGGTSSVMLVSNGVECVMIKREFFLAHCSLKYINWLRLQVQRFPEPEAVLQSIRLWDEWLTLKKSIIIDFRKRGEKRRLFETVNSLFRK